MTKKINDMQVLAQQVASRGRYGDDMLVHMNRHEVDALNQSVGGTITINPDTGQPEAFLPFLMALLSGAAAAAPVAAAAAPLAAAAVPAAAAAIPAAAMAAPAILPAAAMAAPAAASLLPAAASAALPAAASAALPAAATAALPAAATALPAAAAPAIAPAAELAASALPTVTEVAAPAMTPGLSAGAPQLTPELLQSWGQAQMGAAPNIPVPQMAPQMAAAPPNMQNLNPLTSDPMSSLMQSSTSGGGDDDKDSGLFGGLLSMKNLIPGMLLYDLLKQNDIFGLGGDDDDDDDKVTIPKRDPRQDVTAWPGADFTGGVDPEFDYFPNR